MLLREPVQGLSGTVTGVSQDRAPPGTCLFLCPRVLVSNGVCLGKYDANPWHFPWDVPSIAILSLPLPCCDWSDWRPPMEVSGATDAAPVRTLAVSMNRTLITIGIHVCLKISTPCTSRTYIEWMPNLKTAFVASNRRRGRQRRVNEQHTH